METEQLLENNEKKYAEWLRELREKAQGARRDEEEERRWREGKT